MLTLSLRHPIRVPGGVEVELNSTIGNYSPFPLSRSNRRISYGTEVPGAQTTHRFAFYAVSPPPTIKWAGV